MKVRRTLCRWCKAPILWLEDGPTHRPVDAEPTPTYAGCEGLVLDRATRCARWVSDLVNPPAAANMLHYCPVRRPGRGREPGRLGDGIGTALSDTARAQL